MTTIHSIFILSLILGVPGWSNTRTLEARFALSADRNSEFQTRFPVLSPGRLRIEANWKSPTGGRAVALTLMLIHPDGVTVFMKVGKSTLTLEHPVLASELEKPSPNSDVRWTVKILNDGDTSRSEVAGTLRITVPVASRTLEDTQFTLLGSGNAQEIPFYVPAPGRIDIDVTWQLDVLESSQDQTELTTSLIHPGESRTYVRRRSVSPMRLEQQVTEPVLDRGSRWIVRVQNDTQTKVRGQLKITFTPSL